MDHSKKTMTMTMTMKSFAFTLTLAPTLAVGANVRGALAADAGDDLMATCFALADDGTCRANADCTWCKSGAVPSACYPAAKAAALPAGVFECAGRGAAAGTGAAAQAFRLKAGVTHTLEQAEVAGEFCDASSPLSLAGYMNVAGSQFDTHTDKNLFYWFFEKRATSQLPTGGARLEAGNDDDAETPLIVWLTGGPGCSSSLALLTENGPCSPVSGGAAAEVNPYSWTEAAHVLWLDQPADVGYSYGQGNDNNEEMISEDAYYFLQAFFKSEEGRKYKDAPLHIVGESYGGHYAPAIAHRVLLGNRDLHDGLATLNLRGLAVGNGLTNPEVQYGYYAEMAYTKANAVDEATYNRMVENTPGCTDKIAKCNSNDEDASFACQSAFLVCNLELTSVYRRSGKNPYDYSKECGDQPLCYDFDDVVTFMNSDATKEALHVKERNPTWVTCNDQVNGKFHVDWMKNFAPYVADLLNADVPALIYAGDLDFICNYLGNRAWTLELDWDHKEEFNAADEHDWNNGAGLARSANGLTFLQVYQAGHMVPTDQPAHALEMIQQHLNGQSF